MSQPNPYKHSPELMRRVLADPTVNVAEHEVYWPRFRLFLPPAENVSSVLDYGCGPGNFTEELAAMYPGADVLGVDANEAMLPSIPGDASYMQWDGFSDFPDDRKFDLITLKMVIPYIKPGKLPSVCSNIAGTLATGGRIVFSLPHHTKERAAAGIDPLDEGLTPHQYVRDVGQTGLRATLTARDPHAIILRFLQSLPSDYGFLIDEMFSAQRRTLRHPFKGKADERGRFGRTTISLFPTPEYEEIFSGLRANGLGSSDPTEAAEFSKLIAQGMQNLPELSEE